MAHILDLAQNFRCNSCWNRNKPLWVKRLHSPYMFYSLFTSLYYIKRQSKLQEHYRHYNTNLALKKYKSCNLIKVHCSHKKLELLALHSKLLWDLDWETLLQKLNDSLAGNAMKSSTCNIWISERLDKQKTMKVLMLTNTFKAFQQKGCTSLVCQEIWKK